MPDPLPLSGITVVELGDNAAAPFCGQILGDLGADVIKIERPGAGDPSRYFAKPDWNGLSPMFAAINRNKRSVVVDIKDPDDLARLHALIRDKADVFFHNLRPGSAGKFGLDSDSLLKLNPRLVYLTLGAFGNSGPLAKAPGYDPLMQAFGGIMSVTGEQGRPPVRVGVPIIDFGAGLWSTVGIIAAINRRHATGKGGVVDVSLYETAMAWMSFLSAANMATGELPERLGSGTVITAPYRAYECADGYLVVAAANDRLYAKLASALGHPEWTTDPRLSGNIARVDNRDYCDTLIGDILKTAPRAVWREKLDAAGVPNAPLQDIAEVHAHPQTAALGMLLETSNPALKLMGLPLMFEGARPQVRREPPAHGAHTEEVLGPKAGGSKSS
jgi:crotonobetainyl-CoA:carnitine CoA-transferase CaiB-like acyl-CoA transferase